MSIKADLTSDDVDRQIELLKVYPEIADRHYRPVLLKDMQVLKDMILMDTPVRSGNAQKRLGSKVIGKGLSLQGEVGWYGAAGARAWYIRFPEGGTKPHEEQASGGHGKRWMKANKKTSSHYALHFIGRDGTEVFVRKSLRHPGTSARGFVQHAWDSAQSMVTMDLAIANEGIVNELAVP